MTDKERLIDTFEKIDTDYSISNEHSYDLVIVINEYHDYEDKAFWFRFDKVTGDYIEQI